MKLTNRLFFEQVETMLGEGHEVQIRMKGHSMRPLLRNEKDVIVLTPCRDASFLRQRDIVLFRSGKRHVLHRIAQIETAPRTADSRSAVPGGTARQTPAESPSVSGRAPAAKYTPCRFTLAGDGNYRMTEHCTEQDIVAVMTAVIRPSGRMLTCTSRRWRLYSRLWLAIPPRLRRLLLAAGWKLGIN